MACGLLPAPQRSDLLEAHLVTTLPSCGPGIKGRARRPFGPSFPPRPLPRPEESAEPPPRSERTPVVGCVGAPEQSATSERFPKFPDGGATPAPRRGHRCRTPAPPSQSRGERGPMGASRVHGPAGLLGKNPPWPGPAGAALERASGQENVLRSGDRNGSQFLTFGPH